MECDLALSNIDLVITSDSNQDVNKSSSEESSSTLSTINTPVENLNKTLSKLDLKNSNEVDNLIKEQFENEESFKNSKTDIKENLVKEPQTLHLFNKKDRFSNATNCLPIDKNIKPGEFVLKTLFAEFAIIVEKKIDAVLSQESAEKPLSKLLQRGEDVIFDQLLSAFGSVAEHCLPSLLKTLFAWYDRQLSATQNILEQKNQNNDSQSKATGKTVLHESSEKNETICLLEKRDLCIEFIFCLFLIEVLKQLPLHPGHEELINYIETIAFKHFKYVERSQNDINIQNFNIVADLYAEVIGVLAQSRFQSVRKRFINELNELRSKEPSPFLTYSIISLLMGMKFFRIKMVPIQEFEASFQFMQECALYFLELKDKDIKHALAGLFVEILVPVAATVKTEVNVTCLKNFVEMLFTPTLDLCTKKKHMLAICPLVTCLLCVSQKTFFIQNWHYFLVICLSNLKNRDQKISRVALESLYRLLWVYMIRIKCESNTATQSKLHSIVNSLFPKGSKAVVPRDTPLNIFVKIIQFIAQERLDFAMKEIVFDLLSVGRHFKIIMTPERMSIGLRAFLVVADSLQQKEGEPPMPRTSILPSGNAQRVKKTYLAKLLTDDVAKSIGLSQYYPHVKKVLNDILKALDAQFGKPLLKTVVQNTNKEFDEMITAERKPKIDLFRTCIAAIPRLIPEGMSRQQLINLLSRLTIHIDEELSGLAFQSLQNIINDFINWREDVIDCFINFISNEVNDTFPQLIENSLRILLQLLNSWKLSLHQLNKNKTLKDFSGKLSENKANSSIVLNKTEAISIMMLCSCRQPTRRLAALILKETRSLFQALSLKIDDEPVLDIIDRICPNVVENCPAHLITPSERQLLMSTSFNVDLQWLADRVSSSWVSESLELDSNCKIPLAETEPKLNAWSACLMDFLNEISSKKNITSYYAWYMTYQRMNSLFSMIDNTNISDNRASVLLRGAASNLKRNPNEKDDYLSLWKNYLMLVCRIAPSSSSLIQLQRNFPNEISSSPDSVCSSDRSIENKYSYNFSLNSSQLFKTVLPLLRSEQIYLKSATILGLSNVNSNSIMEMLNELSSFLKEAIDRKQENMRRRKRRDVLRLQLGKLLCQIAEKKTFGNCSSILDNETGNLTIILIEYIKGMCLFLKNEGNKELDPQITEIKQQFCVFVTKLISSFSAEKRVNLINKDLRESLFNLFAFFSGNLTSNLFLSNNLSNKHRNSQYEINNITDLNLCALQSMCSVLCCGPVFSKNCLVEESPYFDWLYLLLGSQDERLKNLAQEAIILLLEFNPDVSPLLDWLVDCCFTKNSQVADICFIAMATLFRIREYPCDRYISIINVTLLNVGCPRSNIHQIALQLLHQLDYRFFDTCSKSVFISENVNDDYKPVNDLIEENLEESYVKNESPLKLDEQENENLDESGKQSPIQYRQKSENNSSLSNQVFEPLLNNLFVANQYDLSKRLACLHPEITMPMFSEITHRFQTARPSVCQNLLTYLVPWLFNMELVDSHLPLQGNTLYLIENNKEGWGSIEATEMVLNNLFYITVKFGDLYPPEIENLWIALTSLWLNNMRVVIRYLFIITGLSPSELLPYSKRVAIFMVHAKPEHLIDELMYELQTVESLNCVIERTETPPFYRITNNRKCSSHSDEEEITLANEITTNTVIKVEQGTLHTKRHSTESSEKLLSESLFQQSKNDHLNYISSKTNSVFKTSISNQEPSINSSAKVPLNEESLGFSNKTSETNSCRNPQPHPLPMPEYGGFYAPLTEYLPSSSQPIIGFHRCNLALMLVSDIVLDGIQIDWTPHIPLMIHIIFLGLDHPRALVHEHCKALFINLLLILTKQQNLLDVFKILANNQAQHLNYGLSLNSNLEDSSINFVDPPSSKMSNRVLSKSSSRKSSLSRNKNIYFNLKQDAFEKESDSTLHNCLNVSKNQSTICYKNKDNLEVLIMNLINFLSSRPNKQLWNSEDITAKVWNIRSADQISFFIEHVLKALKTTLPIGHIPERWAEISLQLALSCSSRHYAGRSLQIFRAIKIPINSRTLSDILSRLIETVAEQGEDMQGYVTELMLTLESAVDTLSSDQIMISDFVKNLFKSTPCLEKEPNRKSAPILGSSACQLIRNQYTSHNVNSARNIYNSVVNRKMNNEENFNKNLNNFQCNYPSKNPSSNYQIRYRSNTESDMKSNFKNNYAARYINNSNLNRSRSVQSLKLQEQAYLTPEDRNTLIVQLFMISIAMLETDYEHEFLLALRLLDKVLKNLQLDSKDSQEKIEKILLQSKWNNFQGLHTMLLKGVTSTTTYEPTIMLLHQLTPFLEIPIIDPSDVTNSFPFNVMALLPYMLLNYDEPDTLCTKAAEQIARWCTEKSNKLENLATVMTLYSKRSFSKECLQWTKCVVKYLHDAYSHAFFEIITFLTEVSEKGPSNLIPHIISILNCILDYVDINLISPSIINNDLNKIVSKYVEGTPYKDSLKIIKHIVTRSSTLAAPPSYSSSISSNSTNINSGMNSISSSINYPSSLSSDCVIVASGVTFADGDGSLKHELPGRTMEFSFDLNQTPIVGRKLINKKEKEDNEKNFDNENDSKNENKDDNLPNENTSCSPKRSLSYTHSFNENSSNWRRPWSCQSRVRDKLIGILTSFGQKVGLPKSPSVIFSQNSDIIDRQSSLASSTEEVSAINNELSNDSKIEDGKNIDQFGLFKEFDFLEYELGCQEESMDNFNWGVRRKSLSNLANKNEQNEFDVRLGSPCFNSLSSHIIRKDTDLSSDEEVGSVSPLFNYNNELNLQELSPFMPNNISSSPSSVSSLSSTCSLTILKDL